MKTMIISTIVFLSFALVAQFPSPTNPNDLAPTSPRAVSNTKSITFEGITMSIPNTWNKNGNKNLWTNGKGDSVNLISETAPGYKLKAYVALSIKNMKKMIKTYKVISNGKGKGKNVNYAWYLGNYSLKEVGAKSGTINIYSLFIDAGSSKYVVTIGGLPENFKTMDPIFKKIMKSITLNTSYKKVVDNKGGLKVINKVFSIEVPNGWVKQQGRDMWIDPKTRSSVNAVSENATAYNLNAYLDLSLKNMKKMIPSYKLIKKTTRKVNGNTLGILLGEFEMNKMEIKLYSVVMDSNGMKYVLSVGGPKKSFKLLNKTFNKIINSLKKL